MGYGLCCNLFISLGMACCLQLAWADGDAQRGEEKSVACRACHGLQGISNNDDWPNIAGQKIKYIENQLKAYQSGTRVHPLMSAIAKMLTEQDMQDLASYYSTIPSSTGK